MILTVQLAFILYFLLEIKIIYKNYTSIIFFLLISNLSFSGELREAIKENNISSVYALIKNKSRYNVNKKYTDEYLEYDISCTGSSLLGVCPFHRDSTALHYAAGLWHVDIAVLLIKNGAEVNAIDSSGNNPLHKVFRPIGASGSFPSTMKQKNSMKITSILIKNGVSVNAKNKTGDTPIGLLLTGKYC